MYKFFNPIFIKRNIVYIFTCFICITFTKSYAIDIKNIFIFTQKFKDLNNYTIIYLIISLIPLYSIIIYAYKDFFELFMRKSLFIFLRVHSRKKYLIKTLFKQSLSLLNYISLYLGMQWLMNINYLKSFTLNEIILPFCNMYLFTLFLITLAFLLIILIRNEETINIYLFLLTSIYLLLVRQQNFIADILFLNSYVPILWFSLLGIMICILYILIDNIYFTEV